MNCTAIKESHFFLHINNITTIYTDACFNTLVQWCIYLYKYLKSDLWIYNEVAEHFKKQGAIKFRCMSNRILFRILIAAVDILKLKKVMIFRFHLNKPNTCAEILISLDEALLLKFYIYQPGFITEAQASFLSGTFFLALILMTHIQLSQERKVVYHVMTGCSPWILTLSHRHRCWKAMWWEMLACVNV